MEDGRKRYNCSIIDLFDRSVVATVNSSHMDAELAVQTLKEALERNHHPENLLLHSDQGSQYTSRAFIDYCKEKGIQQSMSKAGCPMAALKGLFRFAE
ncbi:MAG: DDE-type integrase/transposase/recombinase [Lachnospiraceae bacterium]|nr:DDE-type integrase/transposase/recombinase [Lachnospiraceae bacterium]